MPSMQTTTLGRKWLVKMLVFLAAGLALAIWGLFDASVVYPARGARAAEYFRFLYVDALTQGGMTPASVDFDPVEEFARLGRARGLGPLAPADQHKHAWLEQLRIIGRLGPGRVSIPDAVREFQTLASTWRQANGSTRVAVPLSAYDLWVQWGMCGLGVVIAAGLGVHVLRVSRRRYSWDPEAKQLTLPDGSSLTPADVAEFDKRKWDKFLVFLRVREGHARHGGREVKLDLYQHTPLEDWVLEMERIAFPENTPPAELAGTGATNPSPQPAADPGSVPASPDS